MPKNDTEDKGKTGEQDRRNLCQPTCGQPQQEGTDGYGDTEIEDFFYQSSGRFQALHFLSFVGCDNFVGIGWDGEIPRHQNVTPSGGLEPPGIPARLSAAGKQLQIGTV